MSLRLKKIKNFSISVVLPTKNRHFDLSNFFDSLLEQSIFPNQVIVIDQSAENLSEALITNKVNSIKSSTLTYIHNINIKVLVEAKHYSLQYNKSDLICFLEDDVILEKDFIEKIISGFKHNPDMYGCCGVITNPPVINFFYEFFFHLFHIGIYKDIRVGIYGYNNLTQKFFESDKLSGGLSAWRKEVFSYTFFDLKNNLHYTEDIDISSRVSYFFPNSLFINTHARLAHYFSKSSRSNLVVVHSKKIIELIIFYKKRKKITFSFFHLSWLLVGIFLNLLLKTISLLSFEPIRAFFIGLYKGIGFKVVD
jgi:cellulose synthase/poly-beta-1,6-N-acetylglucosamine synthase-like glycosyltransferase